MIVFFPFLALTNCSNPDLVPTSPKNQLYPTQPVVFSGQDDLSTRVAIGSISKTIDLNGLMHFTLQVRNTTNLDSYVDYRITYFDQSHISLDAPTAWQTKTLHSDVFEYIQADAPTPRAKDFQIDFRSAR